MYKRRYKLYLEPESNINVPSTSKRQKSNPIPARGTQSPDLIHPNLTQSDEDDDEPIPARGTQSPDLIHPNLTQSDEDDDEPIPARGTQSPDLIHPNLTQSDEDDDEPIPARGTQSPDLIHPNLTQSDEDDDEPIPARGTQSPDLIHPNLTQSDEDDDELLDFLESHSQDGSETSAEHDDPFTQLGQDSTLDSPLVASGTITKAEALLMVMSHAAKHNITGMQLDDLLTLINTLFEREVLPRSKYLFNKVFKNNSDIVEFHHYCKICKEYLGTQKDVEDNIAVCSNCATPIELSTLNSASFFINVQIAPQIQRQLESPEIQKNLNYRYERSKEEHVIGDIYDGEMYKNLSKPAEVLSNPNNFSFNFNSDGSPVFKSSKFSIWPIQLHLNELPPKLRFQNVVLAGLWFGAHEPVMSIFLKPFVNQANALATSGVIWKRNGIRQNSKVIGLCCCVDSKARPAMQNTTQFNGYFGCGFCLHPGKLVDRQVKYTVTEEDYPDRETNETLSDMESAVELNKSVRGVKGPSPLINMTHFDIVCGFVPDYMHAVLLGVIRQLTELMLHTCDQPYYIGNPNTLKILDKRIGCIKPPHLITRLPRPLSDYKHWKASEWRAWLLFYCLPVLNGVLQTRYLRHLSLLVSGVFLLLKESVTLHDINKADEMLFEFVVRFQMLYGEAQMTFNVHLLTHLCKSVKLWGPLWAHSAFVFENGNGQLLKLFHGTKSVAIQIVNRFLLHKTIPLLTTQYTVCENVKKFCLEKVGRVQSVTRYDDCTVLDSGMVTKTTVGERSAFSAAQKDAPDEVLVHKRMVYKGLVYTSINYTLSKRRKDCYVKLRDGSYGEIQSILSFSSDGITEISVLLKRLQTQTFFPLLQGYGHVSHVSLVRSVFPPLYLLSVKDLFQKCVALKAGDKTYVCDFPNSHERD